MSNVPYQNLLDAILHIRKRYAVKHKKHPTAIDVSEYVLRAIKNNDDWSQHQDPTEAWPSKDGSVGMFFGMKVFVDGRKGFDMRVYGEEDQGNLYLSPRPLGEPAVCPADAIKRGIFNLLTASGKCHIIDNHIFRLFGDRILIRRDPPQAITPGGILIPETAQKKGMWGTVVALGDGAQRLDKNPDNGRMDVPVGKLHAFDVKVGDRVYVHEYPRTDYVDGDGTEWCVQKEEDIFFVAEE